MQHDLTHNLPLAFSIADSCRRLGIGRTLLYRLIKAGEIRTIRLGAKVLIPYPELRRVIDKRLAAAREAQVSA
ncbi:MAG: helix-turn-helix domain-containing protein [Lysobacterales bacterium]